MNRGCVNAVVFDLDGTLVEFNLDYKRLRSEIINLLDKRGLPISLFSTNDRVMKIIEKAERLMANRGKTEREIKEINSAVFSVIDRHEMEAARTTRIIPGVIPTLKALKEKPVKIGIFTLNGRRPTEYILKRFRLEEFFDAAVSREDTSEVKPSPEHLKAVLKILDSKPQETIVVGDSESDMRCARRIGAIAVGIVNERTPLNRLRSAGANHIISSVTDLLTLVRNTTAYRP
ncbi:MAG: HAD family hydrolase [Candidatus Bathyarchaeia archaeon]